MPFLIFTIYDINNGCNLSPMVYRIPQTKNYQYNHKYTCKYKKRLEKIKKELIEDYNEGVNIDELFTIEYFFIDTVPNFKDIDKEEK